MKGTCLCAEVEFEISDKLPNLYQCHCSLCQKTTGSSSCSSFITSVEGFKWISGKDKISSYTKDNGFKSDFCSICGSPVPNRMNIGDYMWVPAGLLEADTDRTIAAHIHLDSRASWEKNANDTKNYPAGPESFEDFVSLLQDVQT
ncbi:MAG: aldehyde-activating protein [Gammaproteobacteria bacterium]|nr:aldehyde-activating protein [Gammaproteobacteria bacterium]